MLYYSTSGQSLKVTLRHAVLAGVAPDGGLYLPERIPQLPKAFFNNMADLTLPEIAYVVANTLFSDDVDSMTLSRVAADVFKFEVPMIPVGNGIFSLELFHGPTASFNDVGARFLAGILPHLKLDPENPVNFLMATAGDSGAAVATALHNMPGAKATVLIPSRSLSRLQLAQLGSLDNNVTTIAVNGNIDFCRKMVADVFADSDLTRQAHLTPASSTNIARFLPQIFCYFHAVAGVMKRNPGKKVVVAVPGGNLGNLSAGLVAKRMGLPVHRFIVTNNVNSTFVNYLETGNFTPAPTVATKASSLDVSVPSNFPRIKALYDGCLEDLRKDVQGRAFTDAEIEMAVNNAARAGYVLDNSTATAYQALADSIDPSTETGVFFAIASPEKSGNAPLSKTSEDLLNRPQHVIPIGRSVEALHKILLNR